MQSCQRDRDRFRKTRTLLQMEEILPDPSRGSRYSWIELMNTFTLAAQAVRRIIMHDRRGRDWNLFRESVDEMIVIYLRIDGLRGNQIVVEVEKTEKDFINIIADSDNVFKNVSE